MTQLSWSYLVYPQLYVLSFFVSMTVGISICCLKETGSSCCYGKRESHGDLVVGQLITLSLTGTVPYSRVHYGTIDDSTDA
jgi:hypothetical protein